MTDDKPLQRTLPPDAPCLLLYDPAQKYPAWVRFGDIDGDWACPPLFITAPGPKVCRGYFPDVTSALQAAKACGYEPTRWAAPRWKKSKPIEDLSLDEPAQYEGVDQRLLDLLARIHGDGGQYTDAHGIEQSVLDAHRIVARLRAGSAAPPKAEHSTDEL